MIGRRTIRYAPESVDLDHSKDELISKSMSCFTWKKFLLFSVEMGPLLIKTRILDGDLSFQISVITPHDCVTASWQRLHFHRPDWGDEQTWLGFAASYNSLEWSARYVMIIDREGSLPCDLLSVRISWTLNYIVTDNYCVHIERYWTPGLLPNGKAAPICRKMSRHSGEEGPRAAPVPLTSPYLKYIANALGKSEVKINGIARFFHWFIFFSFAISTNICILD